MLDSGDNPSPATARRSRDIVEDWSAEVSASLPGWSSQIGFVLGQLKGPDGARSFEDLSVETLRARNVRLYDDLERVRSSMQPVVSKGIVVQEILKIKRAEAEFQTIVVGAFPPDRLSELLGTMSVALVGGGGVAYALSAGLGVAAVLWVFGAVVLGATVWSRAAHQQRHMKLYKERLEAL